MRARVAVPGSPDDIAPGGCLVPVVCCPAPPPAVLLFSPSSPWPLIWSPIPPAASSSSRAPRSLLARLLAYVSFVNTDGNCAPSPAVAMSCPSCVISVLVPVVCCPAPPLCQRGVSVRWEKEYPVFEHRCYDPQLSGLEGQQPRQKKGLKLQMCKKCHGTAKECKGGAGCRATCNTTNRKSCQHLH